MVRSIIGVIVGYIAMFVLNIIGFTALYAVLGARQAFKPRSYLASNRWIVISVAFIFISAVVAGLVCSAIARSRKAAVGLAALIIVAGLVLAIPAVNKARANAGMVRVGEVSMTEARTNAYWPVWAPFSFPFIMAVGALLGANLKKRS